MQIYTQFPNHARKNMKFLSQQVNKSTSQRVFRGEGSVMGLLGSVMGLLGSVFGSAWVCFGSVKKFHTYLIH